jgi:hypothetical protein
MTARPAVARIGSCDEATIDFGLTGERPVPATREIFRVRETKFESRDVRLAGRLVMPPNDAPVPLAVILHGSEDYSGRLYYPEQYRLPAQGIAVFVYDKRGTGDSGGEYTQDFYLLASDAAAALDEARRLAGRRAGRVGFVGGSQPEGSRRSRRRRRPLISCWWATAWPRETDATRSPRTTVRASTRWLLQR